MILWKIWIKTQEKIFFPYDTGEALAFLLWKVVFFSCFFFTKSHLSCAFGSFPSFSVINLTNRLIALVFLKGFWMNVFSHLSCDCKYFWFLSFDREKVSMLLCILYFSQFSFDFSYFEIFLFLIILDLSKIDLSSDESPCDFDHFWKMTWFSLFLSSFLISQGFSTKKWLFSLKRCLIYLEIMKIKGFFNE